MTNHWNYPYQIVTIDTGYAYEWRGRCPLRVGDRVLVPGNYVVGPDPFEAVVTALDSEDDDGIHSGVIDLLERVEVPS